MKTKRTRNKVHLFVHINMKFLGIPELKDDFICIKNKKGHFHIYKENEKSDLGVVVSNQSEMSLNKQKKKELENIEKKNKQHTLLKGGSPLQKEFKKEFGKLIKNLYSFYKEFMWIQNHTYDNLNPPVCCHYSFGPESDLKNVGKNKSKSVYFKINTETDLDNLVQKIQNRKTPDYFEMLVESENLLQISPVSSLILSISSLEVLLKVYVIEKFPTVNIEFTNISSLISLILPILDKQSIIRVKSSDLELIKNLICKRNKIIHGANTPNTIEKDASKAITLIKDLMILIENDIYSFKRIEASKKLLEINEGCEVLNSLEKKDH